LPSTRTSRSAGCSPGGSARRHEHRCGGQAGAERRSSPTTAPPLRRVRRRARPSCSGGERAALHDQLCDLDRIQRGAFAEIVGDNEEDKSVVYGWVAPDATNEDVVDPGCVTWRGEVLHLDARRFAEYPACVFCRERPL